MKKLLIVGMALWAALSSTASAADTKSTALRKVRWGMTPAEVLRAEEEGKKKK